MIQQMPQTVSRPQLSRETKLTVYYVAWRLRSTHPWNSEEFFNRFEAQDKYFSLIERGIEAYLETRQRNAAA